MNFIIVTIFSFILLAEKAPQVKQHGEHKNHQHTKGAHHQHGADHKMNAGLKELKPTQALISVQGMVCAFCAQGIEKNFNKQKEVASTQVDLDKMEVLIKFKKGMSLDEKAIEKIVVGAGFAFKGIKK